jgi:hypothetical protein
LTLAAPHSSYSPPGLNIEQKELFTKNISPASLVDFC